MGFEYDPDKSRSNAEKHGIDFIAAQWLWKDAGLLILTSKYQKEPRYLAIGKISNIFWTAIFTEREDKIRLISVRRSRIEERELYEQNQ